jgi:hypothetical protein
MERFEHHTEGEWIDTKHNNLVINSDYRCEGRSPEPISAWTQILDDSAALIQLCPWFLKQLKGKEFAYITPGALMALSTNPLPSTLSDRPQIEYFGLLDSTILHEVCITAVSCTNEGRS